MNGGYVVDIYGAIVRRFTLEDIPQMKEIVMAEGMPYDPRAIQTFLSKKGNYGFVVLVDGKIIGLAYAYELVRMDKTAPMLYVHSVGLLPAYQNKGLGTRLMAYITAYAKEHGFSECFVIADKGNAPACKVYQTVGGKSACADEIVYVMDFVK